MNTNSLVRINLQKIVHETIDGETVILNLDTGSYYSLVGTGVCIWSFIEEGITVKDITEKIRCSYECEGLDIEAGVAEFISELLKESITVIDPTDKSGSVQSSFEQEEKDISRKKQNFDAPVLNKYSDMQDLLLLDPIHEVDEKAGWPTNKTELANQ